MVFRKILGGKKKDGRGPGFFSRSRGLDDLTGRFSPGVVEQATEELVGRSSRILEIGCGEGRLLLDLRRRLGGAELHGINRKIWPAVEDGRFLQRTAQMHRIFDTAEFKSIELPAVHFYNAEKLRFEDSSVDLIVSQVAIPYVRRKNLLLQEVWRVLKPGGRALLNIDSRWPELPDFLDFSTPRFIIYDGRRSVPLQELVVNWKQAGFEFDLEEVESPKKNGRFDINLLIRKSVERPLPFGYEFDKVSSFNLRQLRARPGAPGMYWGYRSVFRRPEDRAV